MDTGLLGGRGQSQRKPAVVLHGGPGSGATPWVIEQWLVLGASWGSTLGLAHAIEYSQRVSELVLWPVVTTRERDVHWFTHIMGEVYPEEFDHLSSVLPRGEWQGIIPAGSTGC